MDIMAQLKLYILINIVYNVQTLNIKACPSGYYADDTTNLCVLNCPASSYIYTNLTCVNQCPGNTYANINNICVTSLLCPITINSVTIYYFADDTSKKCVMSKLINYIRMS
jgi:hypothetical protein